LQTSDFWNLDWYGDWGQVNLTVLGSRIQILTGPTVLSVPYTLLSNPVTGNWLIKQSYVEAYLSPEHKKISEKKLNNIRRTDYVAFANPVLRSKNEFAMVDSIAGMIRGSSGGISSLAELPETEVEAINFAKTFKGKKELYFGKDANIDNLISVNLDNVSVLSFSTHGVLAGEVDGAKSSSIVLSPTKNNNGLIPTDWLFSLTGSPHLAILSTCNSGTSAHPLDSSELTSLASVFLLKGSGAVISSYWQVDSQGTVEMMGRLSREITQSSSYSIAFLQAIRGLQADAKWNHPSVWAAFVMIGNHNINLKIAEVDNVIKLDINGFVRDWYKKNNTTVLLGFDNGVKDEWKISETTIDLNLKTPVTSIRKDNTYESYIDVQVSKANKFGKIAAIRNSDSWTFSNVTESGDFVKICTLEKVALDWFIGDFFKTKTHIFSLFKRSAEDGVEYGLASISIKNCNPIINAPFHFKTGIKGYANLRLFPISGGEDIVFSTEAPISGKGVIFSGTLSELGVAPSCSFDTVNTYYTLGSDLTQKRSFTFGNIYIDNIRLAGTPIGVIGLDRDPCTKKVTVRFLSDDFFKSKNSSNLEKTIINSNRASIEISELISNNFEEIQHLWWEPGAEYLYISGTPIFPARFSKNITEEIIGKDAFSEWLSGLSSVYSYNLLTKKWLKIATAEQCAFPQPLGYDKGSFFMCSDGFKIQNKSVFLKRNF
jgi:hypothetical protein